MYYLMVLLDTYKLATCHFDPHVFAQMSSAYTNFAVSRLDAVKNTREGAEIYRIVRGRVEKWARHKSLNSQRIFGLEVEEAIQAYYSRGEAGLRDTLGEAEHLKRPFALELWHSYGMILPFYMLSTLKRLEDLPSKLVEEEIMWQVLPKWLDENRGSREKDEADALDAFAEPHLERFNKIRQLFGGFNDTETPPGRFSLGDIVFILAGTMFEFIHDKWPQGKRTRRTFRERFPELLNIEMSRGIRMNDSMFDTDWSIAPVMRKMADDLFNEWDTLVKVGLLGGDMIDEFMYYKTCTVLPKVLDTVLSKAEDISHPNETLNLVDHLELLRSFKYDLCYAACVMRLMNYDIWHNPALDDHKRRFCSYQNVFMNSYMDNTDCEVHKETVDIFWNDKTVTIRLYSNEEIIEEYRKAARMAHAVLYESVALFIADSYINEMKAVEQLEPIMRAYISAAIARENGTLACDDHQLVETVLLKKAQLIAKAMFPKN